MEERGCNRVMSERECSSVRVCVCGGGGYVRECSSVAGLGREDGRSGMEAEGERLWPAECVCGGGGGRDGNVCGGEGGRDGNGGGGGG